MAGKEQQCHKMLDFLIAPLQKRLKTEGKNLPKMEEDFKGTTKAYKVDLKKAGQNTVKAQQKARKIGEKVCLLTIVTIPSCHVRNGRRLWTRRSRYVSACLRVLT